MTGSYSYLLGAKSSFVSSRCDFGQTTCRIGSRMGTCIYLWSASSVVYCGHCSLRVAYSRLPAAPSFSSPSSWNIVDRHHPPAIARTTGTGDGAPLLHRDGHLYRKKRSSPPSAEVRHRTSERQRSPLSRRLV